MATIGLKGLCPAPRDPLDEISTAQFEALGTTATAKPAPVTAPAVEGPKVLHMHGISSGATPGATNENRQAAAPLDVAFERFDRPAIEARHVEQINGRVAIERFQRGIAQK